MHMDRRNFLKTTVVAAAGASLARPASGETEVRNGMPYRTLGRTGEKVSLICVGGAHVGRPFVGEKECRRLHETFFQDPEVTDVMTFPGEEEDQHAGDIAICPAVAAACSGSLFARELTLYLVHACLHLAGFRDQDEGSRRAMRRAEGIILSHLHRTGGILVAEWKDYPASPEA